tara:strand:+ start:122 stop:373 length:252 start_codon:yes stop_codon:yes gene_type:complete
MKKSIVSAYVQDITIAVIVLTFLSVAGYYAVEQFIIHRNPIHFLMLGLSILFAFIVGKSLSVTLKMCAYYPTKAKIKTLIKNW